MKTTTIRALVPALLASTALAIAGCGASVSVGGITIDQGKAEKMVVDGLGGGNEQINARAAVCPGGVDAEKGETFDCAVTWEDGGRGSVTVHIESDEGKVGFDERDVTYPPSAIDADKTEALVRDNSSFTDGERAEVDCPDGIPSKRGSTFRCDVVAGGASGTVTIHVTSAGGDVHFDERDFRDG